MNNADQHKLRSVNMLAHVSVFTVGNETVEILVYSLGNQGSPPVALAAVCSKTVALL